MNLADWLKQNLSQEYLKPDPLYGIDGQCVNAASSWSLAQGGPELMGATAWDIYENFRNPFYEVSPRSLGTALQPGDILFYAPNDTSMGTGPAGHVDIFIKMTGATSFQAADTDWNGSPLLQLETHDINNVAGFFRPVGGNDVTQEQYQVLEAQIADIKQWQLNIYQVLAGQVPLDQLPSNVVAMLTDMKVWELNIDNDVKGKTQPPKAAS